MWSGGRLGRDGRWAREQESWHCTGQSQVDLMIMKIGWMVVVEIMWTIMWGKKHCTGQSQVNLITVIIMKIRWWWKLCEFVFPMTTVSVLWMFNVSTAHDVWYTYLISFWCLMFGQRDVWEGARDRLHRPLLRPRWHHHHDEKAKGDWSRVNMCVIIGPRCPWGPIYGSSSL